MANTKIQLKRSSVAGKIPTTSDISIGELGLNLTDRILYSSDGTNIFAVGANLANQRITNSLTFDNDKNLYFKTVNASATVGFRQQNDDNFVFYSTNTTYGARPVFAIFANSDTSAFNVLTPVLFNANVTLGTVAVSANGSTGTAGQVLTTNGSSTYWSTVSGGSGGSVNVDAQYVWTNTQTFQANIAFTGNNISVVSNTGSVMFGGAGDTNWRIGRSTGSTTKTYYSNNTLDILAAASNLEGVVIGQPGGNTYLETGYAGTFTKNPIYVGNSTQNVTTTNTAVNLQANSTVNSSITTALVQIANSTGNVQLTATSVAARTSTTINATMTSSLLQISNSTSTANLTALDLKIGATTVVNSTQITATLHVGNVSGSYANITGQVNTATLYAATSANIASAVQANSTGLWTTGTVNAATHTTGATFGGATAGATVNTTLIGVSSNSTVNASLTATTFQVSNASGNAQQTATSFLIQSNSTVNSTHTAALLQISNSTSTANLTALDLKIGATTVVNSTQITATLHVGNVSGSYANITGQVNTGTLYVTTSANVGTAVVANGTGLWTTGTVNASTIQVGTSVVADATLLTLGTGVGLRANGSVGLSGQFLTSNGTSAYWSSGVTANAASYTFTANGTQTAFTLGAGVSYPNNALVILDGLVQVPNTDYTISSTTLTFTTAPANNTLVEVRNFEGVTTVVSNNTGVSTGKAIAMAMIFGG